MAVLYRKYRSQNFSEILGQQAIIQTLKNQVANNSLAHAYLFCGSRGVGKTSVARILAKAVNCLHGEKKKGKSEKEDQKSQNQKPESFSDACGKCEVCKQIENGNFIDLVEIDAASNTGVDNIRELIEHVKFAPSIGRYKVFIIDEVHMLSKGAFNALLKTLEEPPTHTIFILATTEISKVPATIISRTQRFDFKRLTAEEIFLHLGKILKQEKFKLDKEVLELIANNSDGSVRDGLSLLGKIMTLGQDANLEDCMSLLGVTDIALCEELTEKILTGQINEIPDFFTKLSEHGVDLTIFNKDFLEYLRKILVYFVTSGAEDFGFQKNHLERLQVFSQSSGGLHKIIFFIRLFLKAYKDLSDSPDPLVPLLIAALEAAGKNQKVGTELGTKENILTSAAQTLVTQNLQVSKMEPEKIVIQAEQKNIEIPNKLTEQKSDQNLFVENTLGLADFKQEKTVLPDSDSISLQEVEIFWSQVIAKIKSVNSPLANLVRSASLLEVSNGSLILGVKFLFNKQSLEQQKNRQIILNAIYETSGKNLNFKTEVIKQNEVENFIESKNPIAAIGDALKIFGGEVVN